MRSLIVILLLAMPAASAGDRPVLLITPNGVFQSTVASGIPGPWVPLGADVIIQGFGTPPDKPPVDPPKPPVVDEQVKAIELISKTTLKNKDEAIAVAAMVNSLSKLGLNPIDFRQTIEMAAPIADTALSAGGRVTSWVKQSLVVTGDPAKLKAGIIAAFAIDPNVVNTIHEAAISPNAPATEEAINFLQIIEIIRMILELLKNLGIGGK